MSATYTQRIALEAVRDGRVVRRLPNGPDRGPVWDLPPSVSDGALLDLDRNGWVVLPRGAQVERAVELTAAGRAELSADVGSEA